jgi:hypothetical protein
MAIYIRLTLVITRKEKLLEELHPRRETNERPHGTMCASVASPSWIQTGPGLGVDSNCDRKTTETGRQLSSSYPWQIWLQKRSSQALSQMLSRETPTQGTSHVRPDPTFDRAAPEGSEAYCDRPLHEFAGQPASSRPLGAVQGRACGQPRPGAAPTNAYSGRPTLATLLETAKRSADQ